MVGAFLSLESRLFPAVEVVVNRECVSLETEVVSLKSD